MATPAWSSTQRSATVRLRLTRGTWSGSSSAPTSAQKPANQSPLQMLPVCVGASRSADPWRGKGHFKRKWQASQQHTLTLAHQPAYTLTCAITLNVDTRAGRALLGGGVAGRALFVRAGRALLGGKVTSLAEGAGGRRRAGAGRWHVQGSGN